MTTQEELTEMRDRLAFWQSIRSTTRGAHRGALTRRIAVLAAEIAAAEREVV